MRAARGALAAALLSTGWAAWATPPAGRAVAVSGCQKDTDCKGERVCERHECVFPRPRAARKPPAAAPVPPPPAAAAPVAVNPTAPRHVTPEDCAPLATAALATGTEIHAGPDPATATIATLDHLTPACAGKERQGPGFRRVRLTDGTDGFVEESDIADLTRPAPPRPLAAPARAAAPAPERMTAEDCSPLFPAFLAEGATVRASPDAHSRDLVRVDAAIPVCAASDAQGFGMRRVRLPDGTEGFVKESDLSE